MTLRTLLVDRSLTWALVRAAALAVVLSGWLVDGVEAERPLRRTDLGTDS